MASNLDEHNVVNADLETLGDETSWQLNALTEALGDLTLTVHDSLSIGRGNDNDVVLGSKSVSRNHALLSVLNGKLYIKDLDSSNGTFVNDERIEGNKSQHLNADDIVGFVSFSFQVMQPIAAAGDVEQPVLEAMQVSGTDSPIIAATSLPVTDKAAADADVAKAVEPLEDLTATDAQLVSSSVAPVVEEDVVIASSIVDDTLSTSKTTEPVVKETIIAEILASTARSTDAAADIADVVPSSTLSSDMVPDQEVVISNDTSKKMLNKEPVTSTPLTSQPLAKESTVHQEPVVTPEHDKTTKTALQEEADPDILRAKQAATGQLSGTANLGQSHDVGTEGNNAMDQAISNPANTGNIEKKSGGGWFIWVLIAILIIGLALWLFNMGVV